MKKMKAINKNDSNMVVHITYGILLSLAVSFLLSIVLTIILNKEIVAIANIRVACVVIHVISALIGTLLSVSLEKGRTAVIAGAVGSVFFLLLLCINMLVFSSGLDGIIAGLISIFGGCLIAVLINSKFSYHKKHRVKVRSR